MYAYKGFDGFLRVELGATRLELVTPCVSSRYSNQLS